MPLVVDAERLEHLGMVALRVGNHLEQHVAFLVARHRHVLVVEGIGVRQVIVEQEHVFVFVSLGFEFLQLLLRLQFLGLARLVTVSHFQDGGGRLRHDVPREADVIVVSVLGADGEPDDVEVVYEGGHHVDLARHVDGSKQSDADFVVALKVDISGLFTLDILASHLFKWSWRCAAVV